MDKANVSIKLKLNDKPGSTQRGIFNSFALTTTTQF
ncbi:MAG: hypothetical protein JWQ57_2723 [Mucilaginibacter sp.]|nr:hypothetical protein [Mucilaginibacter sp.]